MQSDQVIPRRAEELMYLFDLRCEAFVCTDQRRQFQAEERDRFAGCTELQPAAQRHDYHQCIERQMHQLG